MMHYNPYRPDAYSGIGHPSKPFPCGETVGVFVGGLGNADAITCEDCKRAHHAEFMEKHGLTDEDLEYPPEHLAAFRGQG